MNLSDLWYDGDFRKGGASSKCFLAYIAISTALSREFKQAERSAVTESWWGDECRPQSYCFQTCAILKARISHIFDIYIFQTWTSFKNSIRDIAAVQTDSLQFSTVFENTSTHDYVKWQHYAFQMTSGKYRHVYLHKICKPAKLIKRSDFHTGKIEYIQAVTSHRSCLPAGQFTIPIPIKSIDTDILHHRILELYDAVISLLYYRKDIIASVIIDQQMPYTVFLCGIFRYMDRDTNRIVLPSLKIWKPIIVLIWHTYNPGEFILRKHEGVCFTFIGSIYLIKRQIGFFYRYTGLPHRDHLVLTGAEVSEYQFTPAFIGSIVWFRLQGTSLPCTCEIQPVRSRRDIDFKGSISHHLKRGVSAIVTETHVTIGRQYHQNTLRVLRFDLIRHRRPGFLIFVQRLIGNIYLQIFVCS